MLDIYVEFMAYDVIQEVKREDRDKISITGRSQISDEKRLTLSAKIQTREEIQKKKDNRKMLKLPILVTNL